MAATLTTGQRASAIFAALVGVAAGLVFLTPVSALLFLGRFGAHMGSSSAGPSEPPPPPSWLEFHHAHGLLSALVTMLMGGASLLVVSWILRSNDVPPSVSAGWIAGGAVAGLYAGAALGAIGTWLWPGPESAFLWFVLVIMASSLAAIEGTYLIRTAHGRERLLVAYAVMIAAAYIIGFLVGPLIVPGL